MHGHTLENALLTLPVGADASACAHACLAAPTCRFFNYLRTSTGAVTCSLKAATATVQEPAQGPEPWKKNYQLYTRRDWVCAETNPAAFTTAAATTTSAVTVTSADLEGSLVGPCRDLDYFEGPKSGFLQGHTLENALLTLPVGADASACARACLAAPTCRFFNYLRTGTGAVTCSLKAATAAVQALAQGPEPWKKKYQPYTRRDWVCAETNPAAFTTAAVTTTSAVTATSADLEGSLVGPCRDLDYFEGPESGFLQGHALENALLQLPARADPSACARACLAVPTCRFFNYLRTGTGAVTCSLKAATATVQEPAQGPEPWKKKYQLYTRRDWVCDGSRPPPRQQ